MVEVDAFSYERSGLDLLGPKSSRLRGVCTPGWELLLGEARMVVMFRRMSASCQ
jgi:hypothetical protein